MRGENLRKVLQCYEFRIRGYELYIQQNTFLKCTGSHIISSPLFISSLLKTQTPGSLSVPEEPDASLPFLSPPSFPLTIGKPWKNRVEGGRQTPESELANMQEQGEPMSVNQLIVHPDGEGEGEGRGAERERGVTTDAPVICTVWVSAVGSKAATETAAARFSLTSVNNAEEQDGKAERLSKRRKWASHIESKSGRSWR